MEYVTFYVSDRPQVCWDWYLSRKNLEFLRGIDSDYYVHMGEAHAPHLDSESKLQAAAALRIAYSQGLETLMALLCASMQAPTCVVGWMLSYHDSELRKMVKGVSSGLPPNVLGVFRPVTWDSMAKHVHTGISWDDEKNVWVQRGFGRLWSRLAGDYLDEHSSQEYNALKHGTRPCLGGFHLAFGVQTAEGVPASPEVMQSLGGSEFGSSFFTAEKIGDKKLHFRPRNVSQNWMPKNIVNGLGLIAMSIRNVTGFLRIVNGDPPEECAFFAPQEESLFDLPWAEHCGVTSSTMDTELGPKDVNLWTKQEVLKELGRRAGEDSG